MVREPTAVHSSRASAILFALAIALSALCIGALHTPVLCGIAVLVSIAAMVAWFPAQPYRPPLAATILLLVGVFLTAFTALQAIPLPASVVRSLSPAAADVWAGALSPLREGGPAWITLSLDPIATRVQVLRGVVYVASFAVGLRVAANPGGTRLLAIVIVATALVLAISAVLHPALGAHRVFGIYTPKESVEPRHVAPLLNPNHLAAYLNLGYCLALGLAFDARAPRLRFAAGAVALVLLSTQFWVASRGGIAAMVFGTACFLLVVLLAGGTSQKRTAIAAILPGLAVVAGLLMLVLGSSEEAVSELNDTSVSKVGLALSGLPLALRYPLFGVGRGAFEVAFPSVRHALGYVNFKDPENILVQWITEWGIPVAIVALVAIAVALRPRARALKDSKVVGAWAALAATAVQNLVDFNSEVPAIGVAAAGCAAILVMGGGKPHGAATHLWARHPRLLVAAIGIAAALSIVTAMNGWPHELDAERANLYTEATQSAPPAGLASLIHDSLERHPSDAYIPFIAGVFASRRRESILPWVERALTLSPIYAPAHFILAEQLEVTAPAQARLEYRLATAQSSSAALTFDRDILPRIVRLVGSFDDALELAPEAATLRGPVLDELASAVMQRLPATSERIDEVVLPIAPDLPGPYWRAVEGALADAADHDAASWCQDRSACLAHGLAAVRELATRLPGQCNVFSARAKLRLAAENSGTALRELQEEAQEATDPVNCWRTLGELALASKEEKFVKIAEEAMSRARCTTDTECADHLVWVAGLEEARGNPRTALNYLQQAREKVPERVDIAERTAGLASRLDMHSVAVDAYKSLARSNPDGGKWEELAAHEQVLLLHQAAP